mmetsp:Transcript_9023/g.31869  ORF Transcript_9023/g.31869 Transcript_9023/m.31869 type:complete len:203 (-) Transcript_9023:430-1038(-)
MAASMRRDGDGMPSIIAIGVPKSPVPMPPLPRPSLCSGDDAGATLAPASPPPPPPPPPAAAPSPALAVAANLNFSSISAFIFSVTTPPSTLSSARVSAPICSHAASSTSSAGLRTISSRSTKGATVTRPRRPTRRFQPSALPRIVSASCARHSPTPRMFLPVSAASRKGVNLSSATMPPQARSSARKSLRKRSLAWPTLLQR